MKKIISINLTLIFMLVIISSCFTVSANENVNVQISAAGADPNFEDDKLVLVSGVWNYINVSMNSEQPRDLGLVLYKGDELPNDKNRTSYYEWMYDQDKSNHWISMIQYNDFNYIDTSKCKKIGSLYSFYIGISDFLPNIPFYKEEWTLDIYENNQKTYSECFYLEKPTKGIAHSHGDVIYFYIDPFNEMDASGNDFFTLKNTGNVPLDISVSYSDLEYLIEYTHFTKRIAPSKSANYHVSLHSGSWPPQLITDMGEGVGKIPEEYIIDDTDAFVYLKSALAIGVPDLRVFVGHNKYELVENLFDIGLSFQYKKSLKMDEGEIKDLDVYISGDGRLNLDIWTDDTDNIRILKILKNGQEINSPFDIYSTSSSEQKITIRVEAIRERKTGDIKYKLETLDGRSQTYSTHIEINALDDDSSLKKLAEDKKESSLGANTVVTMIVVISIFLVLGYMIVSQLKHKRR